MRQLLLATNNQHKVAELKSLLAALPLEILSLHQFPEIGIPVEDQATLEGNALKKALDVFRHAKVPTLADDTGLEVDYLNRAPGVYSSRYAGPDATYEENCRKLLHELRGVPPRRRGARFRCVVAFAGENGCERIAEGIVYGSIIETPRGAHGFGYDPIFLPSGYSVTLAEMGLNFKNKLSHRSKAIENIIPLLMNYFDLDPPLVSLTTHSS